MSESSKPLVLAIDDEPQIRRLLTVTLEANEYREKLERDPTSPELFITESGVGYRFKAENESKSR